MFNLIVKGNGWANGRDTMFAGRTFEYTAEHLNKRFKPQGVLDFDALVRLPTLFLEESHGTGGQVVHVGTITRARVAGQDIALEYVYDPTIPAFTNDILQGFAVELGIVEFEFARTHWAVKDVDLFRVLMRNMQPARLQPRVFQISDPEQIEPTLVSAMMPFDPKFDAVYEKLQETANNLGLRCRRADDIWENPAVMQDVVSLIDHSKIVICDCSGRNPNVFYEIGIAHTLGREVILITQADTDIPFDLRHLRYVQYLNNGEGLVDLGNTLRDRLDYLTQ